MPKAVTVRIAVGAATDGPFANLIWIAGWGGRPVNFFVTAAEKLGAARPQSNVTRLKR